MLYSKAFPLWNVIFSLLTNSRFAYSGATVAQCFRAFASLGVLEPDLTKQFPRFIFSTVLQSELVGAGILILRVRKLRFKEAQIIAETPSVPISWKL